MENVCCTVCELYVYNDICCVKSFALEDLVSESFNNCKCFNTNNRYLDSYCSAAEGNCNVLFACSCSVECANCKVSCAQGHFCVVAVLCLSSNAAYGICSANVNLCVVRALVYLEGYQADNLNGILNCNTHVCDVEILYAVCCCVDRANSKLACFNDLTATVNEFNDKLDSACVK